MTIHHVAYATRDVPATVRFYEELMGFPLVYTEVETNEGEGFTSTVTHIFFDTGGGADFAFFAIENAGEQDGWATDVSASVGLPVWVNHCSFRATADQQEAVRARMAAAGIEPLMELDHGWCQSLYFVDPNGIMVELCRDTPGFVPDPAEARRLALSADRSP